MTTYATVYLDQIQDDHDSGEIIVWPYADGTNAMPSPNGGTTLGTIQCPVGGTVVGNIGYDTAYTDTHGNVVTFGASLDTGNNWVLAGTVSGSVTLNGVVCYFAGPYCSVPPNFGLEDEQLDDIEALVQVAYWKDPATGEYPTMTKAGHTRIHDGHVADQALTRRGQHHHNPGKHSWHNMKFWTSDGAIGGGGILYATFNWDTRDGTNDGHLRAAGTTIATFSPGGGSSAVPWPAGCVVYYNTSGSAITVNGPASATQVMPPNSFFWLDPTWDVTDPAYYPLVEVAIYGTSNDTDNLDMPLNTHHTHNTLAHGPDIANNTVVRGIKAEASDTGSARDGVVLHGAGGIDITRGSGGANHITIDGTDAGPDYRAGSNGILTDGSGAGSVAVTFSSAMASGPVVVASTDSNSAHCWVTGISSSGFTAHVNNGPATTTISVSWHALIAK